MLEQVICDHCKKSDAPLTKQDRLEIFQRDSEDKKVHHARVHSACADAGAKAHGGTLILDIRP